MRISAQNLLNECFAKYPALRSIGMRSAISINRVSRELLYVPVDPVLIYQAKAWIDMVGYRVFKIFGSLLILLITQWLPISMTVGQLSWFTLCFCMIWIGFIAILRRDYSTVAQQANLF